MSFIRQTMGDESNVKSIPLMKSIFPLIRKSGFDDYFINACKIHLKRIYNSMDNLSNLSDEDYICLLLSKFFISQIDKFPTKRFTYQNPVVWPFQLLPSEVFSEIDLTEHRKKTFDFCNQVGDYLVCRVASNLSNEYQLRVIHKHGSIRMLDDLDITVVMPKSELSPHQKEFACGQLLRVLVSEVVKEEKDSKLIVTINDNRTDVGQFRLPLGPMPEEQLPIYVLHPQQPDGISTFKDYLNSKLGFYYPLNLNSIFESFGLDPKGYYSFFEYNESLNSINASTLLREAKVMDADHLAHRSIHDLERKAFEGALKSIETAIKIYPKESNKDQRDKMQLCKLHEIRGKIHKEREKPRRSSCHVADWNQAYNFDKNNNMMKNEMSQILANTANFLYSKKKYSKAVEVAKSSLMLDEHNVEAQLVVDYIKKKHSEVFINLDEESLLALHEKKKELRNILKMIE